MRRHRFEPAALVMGLVLLTLTVFFILDAGRVWELHRDVSVPLAASGFGLAAATAVVTQVVRTVRGQRARRRRT